MLTAELTVGVGVWYLSFLMLTWRPLQSLPKLLTWCPPWSGSLTPLALHSCPPRQLEVWHVPSATWQQAKPSFSGIAWNQFCSFLLINRGDRIRPHYVRWSGPGQTRLRFFACSWCSFHLLNPPLRLTLVQGPTRHWHCTVKIQLLCTSHVKFIWNITSYEFSVRM